MEKNNGVRFDEVWIANRFRRRKTLKGTRLTVCQRTGYMEPVGRDGFTAEDKVIFIARLKICKNFAQICRSIPIDPQAVYDHIAFDKKFREDVNAAEGAKDRSMQLNDGLLVLKDTEKNQVIKSLFAAAQKYAN